MGRHGSASASMQTVLIHPFSNGQPQECAICLQRFEPMSEAAKLPCGKNHIFHHDCLLEWLQRQPSCPLCREIPSRPKPKAESTDNDVLVRASSRGNSNPWALEGRRSREITQNLDQE